MLKVKKAINSIVLTHPFFSTILLNLIIEPDESIETAGVNNKRLIYNPKFINTLTVNQTIGLFLHEVLHVALLHMFRRKERDFKIWNIAADYIINLTLVEENIYIPENGYYNEDYKGMSTEEVYSIIYKEEKNVKEENTSDNMQSSDVFKNIAPEEWGVVADGVDENNNIIKGEQLEEEKIECELMISKAAFVAQEAGNISLNMQRLLEKERQPILNWRSELIGYMQKLKKNDYSFRRPNRKYIHQNIFIPSLRNEGIDHIIIAVDTSSSIDAKIFSTFIAEINSLFYEITPSLITVIPCNTEVGNVQTFDYYPIDPKIEGYGGTKFKPVFDYIIKENLDADLLIYFTDLEGTIPEESNLHFDTLWICYNNNPNKVVPFGEIIRVNDF